MKIDDTSTFCKLAENYPEHSKRYEEEILDETKDIKLTEEESNIIWNRIQEDIRKLKE